MSSLHSMNVNNIGGAVLWQPSMVTFETFSQCKHEVVEVGSECGLTSVHGTEGSHKCLFLEMSVSYR